MCVLSKYVFLCSSWRLDVRHSRTSYVFPPVFLQRRSLPKSYSSLSPAGLAGFYFLSVFGFLALVFTSTWHQGGYCSIFHVASTLHYHKQTALLDVRQVQSDATDAPKQSPHTASCILSHSSRRPRRRNNSDGSSPTNDL